MRIENMHLIVIGAMFFTLQAVAVFAQEAGVPHNDASAMPVLEEAQIEQPLQFAIFPGAQQYRAGKKIEFDLVLTNVSRGALMVRKLDDKSVYCDMNGRAWGEKDLSGEPVVILLPGEAIRKRLKVDGVFGVGELKVSCSYGMGANGVRPSDVKVLNIVR